MKIEDAALKIVQEKNDSMAGKGHRRLAMELLFLVCVIFALLLACDGGSIFFTGFKYPENNQVDAVIDPALRFNDCKILREDCVNGNDCNLFFLCGEGSYKICKIYDCADTYGIFTRDSEDKPEARREAKYNADTMQAKKDACGKSMEIVEQKCLDDNIQVKVRLKPNPKGDCKIGGFTLVYEGAVVQPNKFTKLQDNDYLITADTCGKITGIIPRTQEGLSVF